MADTTVTANLHETSDAQLKLATKIAFNAVVSFQYLTNPGSFRFCEVTHPRSGVYASARNDISCAC
jgi:hypothetical protein